MPSFKNNMHFVLIDQSLSPEINEEGGNKEQNLPSVQNKDDIVGLSFSEKTERRTDPVLSSRYFLYLYLLGLHFLSVTEGGV